MGRNGRNTDGERIPQGTGIDHVRARVIAGRAYQPDRISTSYGIQPLP